MRCEQRESRRGWICLAPAGRPVVKSCHGPPVQAGARIRRPSALILSLRKLAGAEEGGRSWQWDYSCFSAIVDAGASAVSMRVLVFSTH